MSKINIIQPEGDKPYIAQQVNGEWVEVVAYANASSHVAAGDQHSSAAEVLGQFEASDDAPIEANGWQLVSGPDYIEEVGDLYVYEPA